MGCEASSALVLVKMGYDNPIRGRSRATAKFKMERFVIIVNGWKPLAIITKRSILNIAATQDTPLKAVSYHHKALHFEYCSNPRYAAAYALSKIRGSFVNFFHFFWIYFPVVTGCKLNIHKTFRRRSGQFMFNLRPASTGFNLFVTGRFDIYSWWNRSCTSRCTCCKSYTKGTISVRNLVFQSFLSCSYKMPPVTTELG